MIEGLQTIAKEITCVLETISSEAVNDLAKEILGAKRVFVAGTGRSGLVIRCFAMRLMHLGLCAHIVGDATTPAIGAGDLLLVASGSGSTMSLVGMAQKASAVGAKVALVTIHPNSPVGEMACCVVQINAPAKADGQQNSISVQPMATLFEQSMMVFLDYMVLCLMRHKEFTAQQMFAQHANLE